MNHTNIPKLSLAALLAGFVLVPSSLHAAPVTVENYSFEADGLGTQATDPTGWVRTGAGGYQSFNPTQTPQPSDGASHGWTNGSGAGGPSSLSQIVPAEFIADGATYTLTVDIGQLGPNFTGSEGAIRLIGGAAGAGTPLSNANGTAELAGIAPGSGTPYQTVSVSYTALPAGDPFAGQLIGIELVGTEGTQVLWDNVRLDASSTGEDTTPPTVSRFVPEVGSTGNAASADLEITFIELVRKEAGNITIKESDGDAVVETIDVASDSVVVSDARVTINPTDDLDLGTGYYVEISVGAFEDLAGNDFAGIDDSTTWNFTTEEADTTAPGFSDLSPMNDATEVSPSNALMISFDEDVKKGTGNITIAESDGDAVVETIDIASGNVTISDSDVMINPSNALAAGTGYYVQIASGAIKDFADNDFAGISDKATWNFTTATPLPGGAIAVANGSFETAGSNPEWVPGWTASSSAFRTRTSAPGNVNPTDGGRQAWMNNGTHGYQDTGEPIVSGKTYTLTVDLGADQDNFLDIETVIIRLYGSDLGTGTALAEITPEGPSASGWLTDQTVSFTATAAQATGQTLGIYLEVTSGTQVEWDNVRLNAEVSAPFAITKIIVSPDSESVELTWTSKPGEEFIVKYSTDMTNWDADLDDGVIADAGDSTNRTYGIAGIAGEGGKLFFRVEKQ